MSNHLHLIAVPEREDSLAQALGRTHYDYARRFNKRHRRSGHLWQNRFFSCAVGGKHFWTAMRHVERNPARAGLARRAWGWPWSSAAAHVTGKDPWDLLDLKSWRRLARGRDWRRELSWKEDKAAMDELRLRTRTGRPLADPPVIRQWEALLSRPLAPRPVGRPRIEEK
jgi:putative transposase